MVVDIPDVHRLDNSDHDEQSEGVMQMQQMLSDLVGQLYDLDMVERRERMSKRHIRCDECGSEQVQITDWSTRHVKFKCRRCKHRFVVED